MTTDDLKVEQKLLGAPSKQTLYGDETENDDERFHDTHKSNIKSCCRQRF